MEGLQGLRVRDWAEERKERSGTLADKGSVLVVVVVSSEVKVHTVGGQT